MIHLVWATQMRKQFYLGKKGKERRREEATRIAKVEAALEAQVGILQIDEKGQGILGRRHQCQLI